MYSNEKKLFPDDLSAIWDDSPFDVSVRFVDPKAESKVAWYSDLHIDTTPFLPLPMVFLLIEVPDLLKPAAPPADKEWKDVPPVPKFRDVVERGPGFDIAVRYAQDLGAGFQIFHQYNDRDKIRDGDKLLYVGLRAKEAAEAYATMVDVEVLSVRELRDIYRKKGVDS